MNISIPYRLYDKISDPNNELWREIQTYGDSSQGKSFKGLFLPWASFFIRQKGYEIEEKLRQLMAEIRRR